MTPPAFTRSGKCVDCPPITLRPTTRLAYCTGMRRSLRSTYTMKATTAIINDDQKHHQRERKRSPGGVFRLVNRSATPRGRPKTMPAKISSDIPLPTAALGNLLAQPHDEHAARGQGQHRHQDEAQARGSHEA